MAGVFIFDTRFSMSKGLKKQVLEKELLEVQAEAIKEVIDNI